MDKFLPGRYCWLGFIVGVSQREKVGMCPLAPLGSGADHSQHLDVG